MKKLNLITREQEKEPNVIDIREENIDMGFFENIKQGLLLEATDNKICIRNYGNFEGLSLNLPDKCNYAIGKDSDGLTILVPLKKK